MAALTPQFWLLVALAVAAWIVPAIRVSRMAPHYGRSPRRWFFITLCASALPALIVFWRDYIKSMTARNSGPRFHHHQQSAEGSGDVDEPDLDEPADSEELSAAPRCEHCGAVLESRDDGGRAVCPQCRMTRREDRLA